MAKRGRKRKHKRYFDDPQEKAIIDYLNTDCEKERNKIYEVYLKMPLYKMAESIINKYQYYSHTLSFEELMHDTLSDLHTKIRKFDPTKRNKSGGKVKAYSYFGTIIKHYALGKRIKEQKEMERTSSFESQRDFLTQDVRYSYQMTEEDSAMKEFFYEYIEIIEELLELNAEESFLKVNEEKIGYAVVHLMKNWETVFDDGSNKYNKNQVLECLRNMTNLSTKEIRDNLKRFKKLYYEKKRYKLDQDYKLEINKNSDGQHDNIK